MRSFATYAAVAAVAAVSVAHAQTITPRETPANIPDSMYRTGLPPVLDKPAPPPVTGDSASLNRFRQAYAARRSPRIAIWWNRELSDQVASRWVSETANIGAIAGTAERGWNSAVIGVVGAGVKQTAERTVGDPKRPGLAELPTWDFEAAFANAYLDAGAKLVDRATILRTIGGGQQNTNARPDVQAIEAAALLGKADLLMEVLLTGDPAAKTGWAFRVSAKDIQTGELVMTMVTRATGPETGAPMTFEALPKIDVVSRRLAIESMDRLASAWGAAPLPVAAPTPAAMTPPAVPATGATMPVVPASAEDKLGLEPAVGPRAKIVNDPDVIRVSPLPASKGDEANADAKTGTTAEGASKSP
jgi:hypothetical protein